MTESLADKTIALIATNGFEDSELTKPLAAIKEAGAMVTVISLESGSITGKDGTEISVDETISEANYLQFDGLLLPGGVANPDALRVNNKVVQFVRAMYEDNKPIAAICHAPWLLIEAGVISGKTVTSWPSLKTDILNAGGEWVDETVVVDNGLVTSRKPDDIPAFNAKAIEEFAEGKHTAM